MLPGFYIETIDRHTAGKSETVRFCCFLVPTSGPEISKQNSSLSETR